ncbi:MAG: hypothetical protein M3R34_06820, partial [Acidobacteriota bacterium]|nr:hypothetical protein [Acidobacteriota bacterium]
MSRPVFRRAWLCAGALLLLRGGLAGQTQAQVQVQVQPQAQTERQSESDLARIRARIAALKERLE